MNSKTTFLLVAAALAASASTVGRAAEQHRPAIKSVEIGPRRAFQVNGEPFLPIMAWLLDAENFPAVKQCGMNTVAGYWPGSSGTKDVAQYLGLVEKAGLYGVMPFDRRLRGRPALLAYIHGDEPDLPRQTSDAQVVPGPKLKINSSTPLWRLVDGVTHSWSVLDPLDGASVAIRLKHPVTIERLAVWLTQSGTLPLAKEMTFTADGRKILHATLQPKKGRQSFPLAQPATFSELAFTVDSIHPGKQVWGSISEIEGFDAQGHDLLLAPPRYVPRAEPSATLKEYQAIKAADPSRPVFITFTGNFHPHFGKWTDQQRAALYPQYIAAADVVGYDIYPIYGWNKPEWIHLVYEATRLLARQAEPRPVYAWIETSRGGQYTGPLTRQKEVTGRHIRAEVWMAICGGATAIGYFTHVWKPSYQQFGVPPENRRALAEINAQLTRLAPAILAEPLPTGVAATTTGKVRLAAIARQHQHHRYVFAVNYDPRQVATEATFTVEGLHPEQTIDVVDEGRTITPVEGAFADRFEPLAVHM